MGFLSTSGHVVWPEIRDIDTAHRAAQQGYWAAVTSIIVTLCILAINLLGAQILGLDKWNLLDVALLIVIAIGIRKKIKIAPIVGFVFYLLCQSIITIEHKSTNIVMIVAFSLMYINSYRGIKSWHKFKSETENNKNSKQAVHTTIGFITIIYFSVIIISTISGFNVFNLPKISKWADVSQETAKTLDQKQIYDTNDNIQYLFLESPRSPLESGALITDTKMILFGYWNDKFNISRVHISRIKDINKIDESSFLRSATYQFTIDLDTEEMKFDLTFPTESKGDQQIITYLKDMANQWRQ